MLCTGVLLTAMAAEARAADIVETARQAGEFQTLLRVVDTAGMTPALQGPGPFTVFAPTDAAFAKLPPGALDALLEEGNRSQLVRLLGYHVVTGRLMAATAEEAIVPPAESAAVTAVNNEALTLQRGAGGLTVNGAQTVRRDVPADNGVIQVIDAVLFPPALLQPQH